MEVTKRNRRRTFWLRRRRGDDTRDVAGRRALDERARRERRARERSFVEWPGRRFSRRDPARARRHGDPVGAWVGVARSVLTEKARQYNSFMYYPDFVAIVEARAGVYAPGHLPWMGEVLKGLAEECIKHKRPVLSALCVNADGTVARGFGRALAEAGRADANADVESLAAQERLRCYRYYRAAGLPADGGSPTYGQDLVAPRRSASRQPDPTPTVSAHRHNVPAPRRAASPHTRYVTKSSERPCPQCFLVHKGECL